MTDPELAAIVQAVRAEVRRAMSPWMTEGEAADYLHVAPQWIRDHRADLRPRLFGKRWRYRRDAIDRIGVNPWMDGGTS